MQIKNEVVEENSNDKQVEIVNEKEDKKESDNEDEEPEADTTLFVKNLNFETTDETLKKVIE